MPWTCGLCLNRGSTSRAGERGRGCVLPGGAGGCHRTHPWTGSCVPETGTSFWRLPRRWRRCRSREVLRSLNPSANSAECSLPPQRARHRHHRTSCCRGAEPLTSSRVGTSGASLQPPWGPVTHTGSPANLGAAAGPGMDMVASDWGDGHGRWEHGLPTGLQGQSGGDLRCLSGQHSCAHRTQCTVLGCTGLYWAILGRAEPCRTPPVQGGCCRPRRREGAVVLISRNEQLRCGQIQPKHARLHQSSSAANKDEEQPAWAPLSCLWAAAAPGASVSPLPCQPSCGAAGPWAVGRREPRGAGMWSLCVGGVVLQQKPPVGGLVANRAGCHGCTGRVAMPGRRQGLWGGRWVRAGAARAWAELAEPVRGPSSSHSTHHKLLPLAELPEAGTAHPMPPAQPLALAASPGSTSPLCHVRVSQLLSAQAHRQPKGQQQSAQAPALGGAQCAAGGTGGVAVAAQGGWDGLGVGRHTPHPSGRMLGKGRGRAEARPSPGLGSDTELSAGRCPLGLWCPASVPTTSHTGELRCSHTFAVRVAPLHTHTRVLGHELAPARIRDGVDANPHSTGASSPASLHCQHAIASSPAAVPALCLDSGFHGAGWGPGGLQPVALVPSPATLAQGTGQRLRPGVGASCRQESPVPVGGRWSSLGHSCAEGRKARSRVAQARAGGAALAPVLFTLEREDRRCLGGHT